MKTVLQERNAKNQEIETLTRNATDAKTGLRIRKLQAEIALLDVEIGTERGELVLKERAEDGRRNIETAGRQHLKTWTRSTFMAIGTIPVKEFLTDVEFVTFQLAAHET